MNLKFFVFIFLTISVTKTLSQNTIYALTKKPGTIKQLYMSTVDPITGFVTILSGPLPAQHLQVNAGNAFDFDRGLYYFMSPGPNLEAVNVYTGNSAFTTPLHLNPGYNLSSPQFDCRDSSIYATGWSTNLSTYFGKLDVHTGAFSPSTISIPSLPGESYTFDKVNNRYIYCDDATNIIYSIELSTGIISSIPLPVSANKYFRFIEYNCTDTCLYGLERDHGTFTGYRLAKFDFHNGTYTVLSNIVMGGPLGAGRVLDTYNGIYYVNEGTQIVPIRISDGLILPSAPLTYSQSGTYNLYYIQQAGSCECLKAPVAAIENISEYIIQFSNPFKDELKIMMPDNETVSLTIYDMTSRIIFNKEFNNTISINTEKIPSGIYLLNIEGGKYHYAKKIIKH